jgi:hypothetical protein
LGKFAKISLLLTIIHFMIVSISFLLGSRHNIPDVIMIPLIFYMIFSFYIPINIIILCIIGLIKKEKKFMNIICLIISFTYILAFTIFVIKMWRPGWMGI